MQRLVAGLAASAILGCAVPASAEIWPRSAPAAGSVISRKAGEEARFIEVENWREVEVRQDLLPGDVLRTNATGQLAILFSDRTQIRLGRNTTLRVRRVGEAADSEFSLDAGTIWARAERGGVGLTVDTPAAAAAIRGTDWTMTVDADGRTKLIVLEGQVELSNALGSVLVAEGEAAVAAIGQAPTKIVIVDPDDREQMLFYLSLRGSFAWMPASALPSPAMRQERARIAAIPAEARSGEDWLTLAEAALSYDGRQAAAEAAARARAFRLGWAERARLDLIDALLAGADQHYSEAARLFERAAPALDARRRAIALYGGYFARALADPDRVEAPPAARQGGPYGALAEAWTAGFLKDIPAAIDVIRRAEKEYPDDPTLPAARAQFALLIDDREQVKEAIERALSLDPDDPFALEARANYRAGIESDLDGALADLTRGSEIAPGSTTVWNAIGLVQSARGATREAEAALKRAIELDPRDPVSRANLAILYLDQDRNAEAKAEIDRALADDPSFDVGLVARGRYHMQTGEMDKALEDLLAGSTANPAYAQALLLLAAGYYESGQIEAAEQALENADRLDPNDPVTSSFETAIAIDDYDSDRAIASAQETLKRSLARGGDFAGLSANIDAGSLLNNAFRLQGLDAWGRYYGDAVFDPFSGAALVDQAVSGSPAPFADDLRYGSDPVTPFINENGFSSLFQGLMMSPEILSGRSRSANLLRRPFLEGSVGGGFTKSGGDWGWTREAEVQGYSAGPIPWSFYGQVEVVEADEFREEIDPTDPVPLVRFGLGLEAISGTGYLTARPTPNDRVVAFVDSDKVQDELSDALLVINDPLLPFILGATYDRTVDVRSTTGGLGWSHTLGYRNVVNAAIFASDLDQSSDEVGTLVVSTPAGPVGLPRTLDIEWTQRTYLAALNHSYGVGDLTLRYGVEAGALDYRRIETDSLLPTPTPVDADFTFGRAYVDALYDITPELKAEGGLFATVLDGSGEIERLEPRVGLAWTPWQGHWLRAGYIRETEAATTTTLAPIGIVGLQPNQAPLDLGGYSDSFAARWDAQWTNRLFTSVDYQHQEFQDLAIVVPGSLSTVALEEGRIDRVSATANVWLGHGFGAFATIAFADSENQDPSSPSFGNSLPFVPDTAARLGLTWVNPANLRVTLAGTYVGPRAGDGAADQLDGYWTADAFLTWEPFDKRFELELSAYNLFDQDFEVAASTPGWGRTFIGSLKVRF